VHPLFILKTTDSLSFSNSIKELTCHLKHLSLTRQAKVHPSQEKNIIKKTGRKPAKIKFLELSEYCRDYPGNCIPVLHNSTGKPWDAAVYL